MGLMPREGLSPWRGVRQSQHLHKRAIATVTITIVTIVLVVVLVVSDSQKFSKRKENVLKEVKWNFITANTSMMFNYSC